MPASKATPGCVLIAGFAWPGRRSRCSWLTGLGGSFSTACSRPAFATCCASKPSPYVGRCATGSTSSARGSRAPEWLVEAWIRSAFPECFRRAVDRHALHGIRNAQALRRIVIALFGSIVARRHQTVRTVVAGRRSVAAWCLAATARTATCRIRRCSRERTLTAAASTRAAARTITATTAAMTTQAGRINRRILLRVRTQQASRARLRATLAECSIRTRDNLRYCQCRRGAETS